MRSIRSLVAALTLTSLGLVGSAAGQSNEELKREIDSLRERLEAVESSSTTGDAGGLFTKLRSRFRLYGFARVDAAWDSAELNDVELPVLALSQDPTTGNRDNDSEFAIYTRLTRLGFEFDGPEISLGKLTGRIEVDFYGNLNSDSRNDIRMRHAYLQIADGDLTFLAGQTWDLVSPYYPSANADLLNWNAGNTGDRRPQIRVTYAPEMGDGRLTLGGAIALQGAIDRLNLDADGVTDGEDSGLPQLQVRAAYAMPLVASDTNDFEIGAWAAYGEEETDTPIAGKDDFEVTLFGVDLKIPLTESIWLKGEAWTGENLSDLRGGIGQGINTTTGEEIDSHGYWFEANWRASKGSRIFAGYSEDNPKNGELNATNPVRNQIYYAGYSVTYWDPFVFGVEYLYFDTHYKQLRRGDANRVKFYFAYEF